MAYQMTPARRAALEKAQAASARKRRKLAHRSRTSRLVNRKTAALAAVTTATVGGVAAQRIIAEQRDNQFAADPINQLIINRHVEVARYHNRRLNELRALGIPPQVSRAFSEKAARREAIAIMKRKKKKKS